MLRNIGAVVAGMVAGMVLNGALISANGALYPLPPGADPDDLGQLAAHFATLPWQAYVLVIAAHLGQAALGGWVAARLGASRPVLLALIVGALTMAGGLAMLLMLQPPAWMWLEIPLYLAVAWAAGTQVARAREAAPAPAAALGG